MGVVNRRRRDRVFLKTDSVKSMVCAHGGVLPGTEGWNGGGGGGGG